MKNCRYTTSILNIEKVMVNYMIKMYATDALSRIPSFRKSRKVCTDFEDFWSLSILRAMPSTKWSDKSLIWFQEKDSELEEVCSWKINNSRLDQRRISHKRSTLKHYWSFWNFLGVACCLKKKKGQSKPFSITNH